MKKLLITYYLFLITYYLSAQNLVPNPSFEIKTSCPTAANQLPLASPWVNPTGASPDYFNQCATSFSFVDVPQNSFGYQNARTGVAYAGGFGRGSGSPIREYVQAPLTDSLLSGKKYCVSFYVSLANRSKYAINSFGAYLSNDSIRSTSYQAIPYIPQVINPSTSMLSDTSGWMLISGVLTAVGGEKYVTIGNFNDDTNTDTLLINPSDPSLGSTYYYIDDVSVISYLEAETGNDVIICKRDSTIIGTPPTGGIIYQWQPTTGLNNSTIAQPMAKPYITTTYILTITDNMGNYCVPKNTDTVTVIVRDCDSSSFIETPLPNVFTPNGDGFNDVFKINTKNIKELKCEIYNRWGGKVYEFKKADDVWNGKTTGGLDCTNGVYYYILTAKGIDDKEYEKKGFVQLLR